MYTHYQQSRPLIGDYVTWTSRLTILLQSNQKLYASWVVACSNAPCKNANTCSHGHAPVAGAITRIILNMRGQGTARLEMLCISIANTDGDNHKLEKLCVERQTLSNRFRHLHKQRPRRYLLETLRLTHLHCGPTMVLSTFVQMLQSKCSARRKRNDF